MQFYQDDTIVAVASARGPGSRGIVRITGPETGRCLEACLSKIPGGWKGITTARRVTGHIRLAEPLGLVPVDLYAWPGTRSFTRQPSAELHTIGSLPIVDACVTALCSAGARIARPGEFTMRAFLAGRLDLTQAEAVLGVIDAESQRQLQTALQQMAGGLTTPLHQLRDLLIDQLAHLEAGLDFVEEDIEFISASQLDQRLEHAAETIQQVQLQLQDRGIAGESQRVTLWGEANAGKSSLLNALCRHSSAIVSDVAGTTRDFVTRQVTWDGWAIELCDTAGVALASEDSPDHVAQTATRQQTQQSDLRLLCLDLVAARTEWEKQQLEQADARRIVVWTKADLMVNDAQAQREGIVTSSHSGLGLEALKAAVVETLDQGSFSTSAVPGTAIRCRESLQRAAAAIQQARAELDQDFSEELIAAEMRIALDHLGQVVGAVYTEDVLDRIFSRFCIGK